MTEHDRLRNLTARYALGALASRERALFEQHLRTCAECANEVRSFQPVVAAVAETAPRVLPPAHVKERLLLTVRSNLAPAAPRRLHRRSVWIAAGAVCAIMLAIYVADLHLRIAALTPRADATRTADSAPRTIVVSGSVRHIELSGVPPASRAFGCALLSDGELVVTAGDLPPLAPGTIYQVWIISGGSTVRAGELVATEGHFRSVVPVSGVTAPTEIAVTLERGPGSAPAGGRYLRGAF